MLAEIDELAARVIQSAEDQRPESGYPNAAVKSKHLLQALELLRSESSRRLAFEDAMLEYLTSAGSNPFAAAAAFREFLERDTVGERVAAEQARHAREAGVRA